MPLIAIRRTVLIGAASAILAGCARNGPIVLDRQAMAGIKRIGLPMVGVARSPDVRVVNGVSERMAGLGLVGAIGAISGSIVRANRSDAVVSMMAARGFDPGPALTAMLDSALKARGFIVVPMAAEPKRSFLTTIAAAPEYDAVLDCYVSTYGFYALNDSDDSPFRASVAVPARLVGAGGAVLMQDTVVISSGDKPAVTSAAVAGGASALPATPPLEPGAAAPGTFRSFSDAEKDPTSAVESLRVAFQLAAAGVVRRIT